MSERDRVDANQISFEYASPSQIILLVNCMVDLHLTLVVLILCSEVFRIKNQFEKKKNQGSMI